MYYNSGRYNSPLLEFKLILELGKGLLKIFLEISSLKFLSFLLVDLISTLGVFIVLLSLMDDLVIVTDSLVYH